MLRIGGAPAIAEEQDAMAGLESFSGDVAEDPQSWFTGNFGFFKNFAMAGDDLMKEVGHAFLPQGNALGQICRLEWSNNGGY